VRVAISGAAGRLGSALVAAFGEAPFVGPRGPMAWTREQLDLDAPEGFAARLEADRPEVVVHAAAWTDVDGCAREPESARRRNGLATGALADACAVRGIDLVAVSTNEVFDGRRTDGLGYRFDETPNPINPYGASKLEGERLAREAFAAAGQESQLAIVRTAWLFGPGKPDFPAKILAAAERAQASGEPLRAVGDEWGNPTYVADLAEAIVELVGSGTFAGTHHAVNGMWASRADWASYIVGRAELDVEIEIVPASTWTRPSVPPRWGVLEPTPLPSGEPLRSWPDAMADYAPALLRSGRAATR
jgi:dTDP-4-dehydrorhamnose reductase